MTDRSQGVAVGTAVAWLLTVGCAFFFVGCPHYNVWQQGLAGKAALSRAVEDRQIAIEEARAKKDSAQLLAEAEAIRAAGLAEAIQIVGGALEGNQSYLRYRWIEGLHDGSSELIYVPTEAGLPILEAGRMGAK